MGPLAERPFARFGFKPSSVSNYREKAAIPIPGNDEKYKGVIERAKMVSYVFHPLC
jgi:hypothetical protein